MSIPTHRNNLLLLHWLILKPPKRIQYFLSFQFLSLFTFSVHILKFVKIRFFFILINHPLHQLQRFVKRILFFAIIFLNSQLLHPLLLILQTMCIVCLKNNILIYWTWNILVAGLGSAKCSTSNDFLLSLNAGRLVVEFISGDFKSF